MTSSIIAHSINGVTIGQRSMDGYINATALCKVNNLLTGERKDTSEWLSNKATQSALDKLSVNTGITVLNLVDVKRGKNGGTWIHPRLSVRFAMWLNDDFSLQVEDWVHEWISNGKNPTKNQNSDFDLERLEERLRLKNVARLALTDVCKEEMEYLGWYGDKRRVGLYFAKLFDGMNIAITTETSQQMIKRLSAARDKPMKSDELIRDYFPVEALRLYLCVHNVLTNILLDLPQGDRNAMKHLSPAVKLALPNSFKPEKIEFKLLPCYHQKELFLQ